MALINALDRYKHFDEFNSPLVTGAGVKSPNARKAEALQNLMGLDPGSDGVGAVGSSSTTTATETFDGSLYTTVLDVTAFPIMATIGDNASLAGGALLYTLPAGDILIEGGVLVGTVNAEASVQTDTPEIGVGTVVGSGANATLGAVGATCENVLGPFVAASVNDGAVSGANATTGPFIQASASVRTLYLNAADGWADRDAGTVPLTFTGQIVIKWRKV